MIDAPRGTASRGEGSRQAVGEQTPPAAALPSPSSASEHAKPPMTHASETSRLHPACPSCGNGWVRRVHRSLWMRMFKHSAAYKCDRCGRRFMVRNRPHADTHEHAQ